MVFCRMKIPSLVYATKDGRIYDHPTLRMCVRSGGYNFMPYEAELVELPATSRLYYMPYTRAVGFNLESSGYEEVSDAYAVSVFLPPAWLRLYLPSYRRISDETMPLFAYTAVGFMDGKFVVPALKVDDDRRWHPSLYDYTDAFRPQVEAVVAKYPHNRLYEQLARCALDYHCTAAKNVFYPRWECPIPTSPTCNSSCVGCISLQASECCPSPQERICFAPTAEEIAEVALNHAREAEEPIISFGQGCEGDPVLQADNIAGAIRLIRKEMPELTVNFNSNCSLPAGVEKVLEAGASSIRVSLNSLVESTYNAYYRPRGYSLADVKKSVELANKAGVYVALNLLMMPGINDRKSEVDALLEFLSEYRVELIQTRNLNIDTELLERSLNLKPDEIMGVRNMLTLIKKKHKHIKFGYFNRTKADFCTDRGLPDLKVKRPKS